MAVDVKIEGVEKLSKQFEKLADAKKLKSLRTAIRRGAKPLLQLSKQTAPVGTKPVKTKQGKTHQPGTLKKSIAFKNGKSKDYPTVWLGTNMKRKVDAFYHHIVRTGAKPHRIPKNANKNNKKLTFSVNGKTVSVIKVNHPGVQGDDFMQKAFQSSKPIITPNIIKEIDREIAKYEKAV